MPPALPIPRLVDNGIDDVDAKRLIDWIRWWRPLKVTRQQALGFRHPWDLSARWNGKLARWEIQVEPGYVNGQEVLAGEARLSDRPWIPVPAARFRSLGSGTPAGAESEAIPPYFLHQGVLAAGSDASLADVFGLTTNLSGTLEDRAQARRLMAVDVVLSQPRPRVVTVVEPGPGGSATLALSIDSPTGTAAAPRLELRREATDPEPVAGTIQEMLAAGATDDGLDRLRIGTLYLLSPQGETGPAPDGTWQAVPRNEVFWNLNHAVTVDVRAFQPVRLSFGAAGALAGGLAQAFIEQQLDVIGAADAAAAAFLSRGRVEGRFWTV